MRLEVPYVQQITAWSCAIASAEMVARYHGATEFDQLALYNKLKAPTPGMKGQWCVYNHHLIDALREMGFDVTLIRVNYTSIAQMIETLKINLAGGPLIASQRTSMQALTGHSRVIVGLEDEDADGRGPFVFVHDPNARPQTGVPVGGANRKWKADDFARMWKPKGLIVTGGEAIVVRRRSSS